MNATRIEAEYEITGTVQGVGFRPTVYRLARSANLGGFVQNCSGTVRLVLQGEPDAIDGLIDALPAALPPHAVVESVSLCSKKRFKGQALAPFSIVESRPDNPRAVVIPPDLAICPDCEREILAPTDRRYGYAFTTCTCCGPRYTVVHGMPYDRQRTTMSCFPLCPLCQREYEDPADRRFHAESIACPDCGPRLVLQDENGQDLKSARPLVDARLQLARGAVVAVRGLGGFLLAADASNEITLKQLRARKSRPHKPFAVMADSLATIEKVCSIPPEAAALLQSPQAPIVILDLLPPARRALGCRFDLLTPDANTLGVMLPTTPLHRLLATPVQGDPTPAFPLLVMTSGNRAGEPICLSDDEAHARLSSVADFFLTHNREINLRNDDSLCAIQRGMHAQVWRRARGFAPQSIQLPSRAQRDVLAMGAELKNAIALAFDRAAVLSPHVGDLESPEAIDGLRQVVDCLPRFLEREPEAIAVDLHPDMHATRLGRELARRKGIPVIGIQHHYAHAVSGLAEHGVEDGLALAFDGTGLGTDGNIWGAELLEINRGGAWRRLATFDAVPLPGGDAAVRHPVRQLAARLYWADVDLPPSRWDHLGVHAESLEAWRLQCKRGLNAPLTHAAGRLFDAFSAALGLAPATTTYEGQAAIRLESAARRCRDPKTAPEIPCRKHVHAGLMAIDWSPAFAEFVEQSPRPEDRAAWAYGFHRAIATACESMLEYAIDCSSCRRVVLTGGVFMNRLLTSLVHDVARDHGLQVLVHRKVPPNDGGIAFGQAVAAATGTPRQVEVEKRNTQEDS